jgi:hypothetical protein
MLLVKLGRGFMVRKVVLKDEKILDSWSVLIEDAQGKGKDVYAQTSNFIQESRAPGVTSEIVVVRGIEKTGFFGRFGERDYLMVVNERLKDYRMYVGARDYGKNLNVSWYLTCEPGVLKALASGILTKDPRGLSYALGIFQQEELIAYTTAVHHSLLKSVETIMQSLNQDPSKIDRKSRGFLGIS